MKSSSFSKAIVPLLLILTLTVIACYFILNEYSKEKHDKTLNQMINHEESKETDDNSGDLAKLEYETTGILIEKNTDDRELIFRPVEAGKDYLLAYDGTTAIYGKHGNSITLDQLRLGDIVDVAYSVHNGKLKRISLSDMAWTMTEVSKFTINEKRKQMTIGDDTFKIGDDLVVSYGESLAKLMDITEHDTLTVKGIDRKISSIIVDRGHGYLRLTNDAYFVGGWIEVGNDIIKPVTSEMLLPVPEGSYHVKISNRGYAGQKDMIIERDKEEILDLDEIEIEEVSIGHVEFEISPDYAQLYVDDEITDFDERVPLEFGVHKIKVTLAGYETVNTNIKILSDYASVKIALEKSDEESKSSSSNSSSTSSSSTALDTSSTASVILSEMRQLYVEAPVGAEVYLDGNYIGVAPTHTNKVTGQHVLTLSKDGYGTKSYTINVDSDDRDVTYSFSDLIAE